MKIVFEYEQERHLMREVLDSALRVRVRSVTPVALSNLQTLLQLRRYVEEGELQPPADVGPGPGAAPAPTSEAWPVVVPPTVGAGAPPVVLLEDAP